MPLPKPVRSGSHGGGAVPGVTVPSAFSLAHPLISSYLADTSWEDGSARVASTMTVFIEQGRVKLCLNDRDGGQTAWVSGNTFEDATAALELGLESGALDWRASKAALGNAKRRS